MQWRSILEQIWAATLDMLPGLDECSQLGVRKEDPEWEGREEGAPERFPLSLDSNLDGLLSRNQVGQLSEVR